MVTHLTTLKSDRSGNFAILTALLLPLLFGSVALAVNIGDMISQRSKLQDTADSASLAASSALGTQKISTKAEAEALAKSFIKGKLGENYTAAIAVTPNTASNGAVKWTVNISLKQVYKLNSFGNAIGWQTQELAVSSYAVATAGVKNAFSMYFVLDKSGSMQSSTNEIKSNTTCTYYWMPDSNTMKSKSMSPCYNQRIESLKNAVNSVFSTFNKADPNSVYIRTGADAYDSAAMAESKLAWGSSVAKTYVNGLSASGGTSSTSAFKAAVTALTAASETALHIAKSGITPKKYIVFMTDGENNASTDDTATLKLCQQAKDTGITVYSVAFYAPDVGKRLLSACASKPETYFDASNGTALQDAFAKIGEMTAGEMSRLTQ